MNTNMTATRLKLLQDAIAKPSGAYPYGGGEWRVAYQMETEGLISRNACPTCNAGNTFSIAAKGRAALAEAIK